MERGDGSIGQPKMDFVGARTLEFCRRWGIMSWVHNAGYNRDYPQDCAWVSSLNGFEFGRNTFRPRRTKKRSLRASIRAESVVRKTSSILCCDASPSRFRK